MLLTAGQIRAARGLLGWTREDLAKASGLAIQTLKNMEHGVTRPQEATTGAIIRLFAMHDIQFTENEGVKRERNHTKTFVGAEGYKDFLDHIYSEMKDCGGDIRQFNITEAGFFFTPEYADIHMERMSKIKDLNARVLLPRGDTNFQASYCIYRWINKDQVVFVPYYVYGKNLAMFSTKSEKDIEVISIKSELLSSIFIEQFAAIWEKATIPQQKRL